MGKNYEVKRKKEERKKINRNVICLGEMAVRFLNRLCNRLLTGERIPRVWRKSILVPIFKIKGDAQNFSIYGGIKLISHSLNMCERIVEARLRGVVEISEQQLDSCQEKAL